MHGKTHLYSCILPVEEEQRMKKFARIRLQERRKEPQLFFMRFFAFFAGFYAEKRKGTDIKRRNPAGFCQLSQKREGR